MRILDSNEVCKLLKISRRTLYRRIKSSGFPYIQSNVKGKLSFNEEEIIKWLNQKSHQEVGKARIKLISRKK